VGAAASSAAFAASVWRPVCPPALHEDVEHDAVLVHRAPQPVFLAGEFDGDPVQVPLVSGTGQNRWLGSPLVCGEGDFLSAKPVRGTTLAPKLPEANGCRIRFFSQE
jgi:hypothetical protein